MKPETINQAALSLLAHARTVASYEELLARETGEDFNLFNILRIRHHEVSTHSPMLAELLNPMGSHRQGSIFLNLFVREFGVPAFETNGAKVFQEYYIGPKRLSKKSIFRRFFVA